jgi:shikimate kinase
MDGEILEIENPAGAGVDDYRLVLEQIKSIHAGGGSPLSRQDAAELVKPNFVWLGWPESKIFDTLRRGRPRKKLLTQYDSDASKLRRTLHHRLVRNPVNAKSGGVAMQAATLSTRDLIFELARTFSVSERVKKHERVQKTMAALQRFKKPKSLSTVQRALRAFDKQT